MRAIILAAGRGSRMNDLTDDRPKCLVELRGKPLLEWQLAAIREAGITEIAIVTGYKRELLARYELTEFHNPRWAETQMLSSLAYAKKWLESSPSIVRKVMAVARSHDCRRNCARSVISPEKPTRRTTPSSPTEPPISV